MVCRGDRGVPLRGSRQDALDLVKGAFPGSQDVAAIPEGGDRVLAARGFAKRGGRGVGRTKAQDTGNQRRRDEAVAAVAGRLQQRNAGRADVGMHLRIFQKQRLQGSDERPEGRDAGGGLRHVRENSALGEDVQTREVDAHAVRVAGPVGLGRQFLAEPPCAGRREAGSKRGEQREREEVAAGVDFAEETFGVRVGTAARRNVRGARLPEDFPEGFVGQLELALQQEEAGVDRRLVKQPPDPHPELEERVPRASPGQPGADGEEFDVRELLLPGHLGLEDRRERRGGGPGGDEVFRDVGEQVEEHLGGHLLRRGDDLGDEGRDVAMPAVGVPSPAAPFNQLLATRDVAEQQRLLHEAVGNALRCRSKPEAASRKRGEIASPEGLVDDREKNRDGRVGEQTALRVQRRRLAENRVSGISETDEPMLRQAVEDLDDALRAPRPLQVAADATGELDERRDVGLHQQKDQQIQAAFRVVEDARG